MKIQQVSGKQERRILTAMVVDQTVCARIASKWQPDLFRSKWANIVGELCVRHVREFDKAPGKAIEGIFESWATEQKDKDTVNLVEKFLGGLSDEYAETAKEINAPYVIDLAAKYFNKVRLQRLFERGMGHIENGKLDDALKSVLEFGKVEMGTASAVNVLNDDEALARAFEERAEPLMTLPGAIGKFFGRSLCREGFISLLAPEKRGKTTWLVWLAAQAIKQRLRVAFFSVGDESEEEMMLRFAVLVAKWPMEPGVIDYPTAITFNEGKAEVEFKSRHIKEPLTFQRAKAAFDEFKREQLKSKREWLRLSVHSNSTLSVRGMEDQLEQWEKEGWVADVVVGDYMDIFQESGGGRDEKRHRIDATWRDMRGLSQRRHALVITATQADAEGGEAKLLTRANFSESKSKRAHVTGEVGLNQTEEEKKQGIFRLNWIVRRGAAYFTDSCCYTAACMALQNPCVRSSFFSEETS